MTSEGEDRSVHAPVELESVFLDPLLVVSLVVVFVCVECVAVDLLDFSLLLLVTSLDALEFVTWFVPDEIPPGEIPVPADPSLYVVVLVVVRTCAVVVSLLFSISIDPPEVCARKFGFEFEVNDDGHEICIREILLLEET